MRPCSETCPRSIECLRILTFAEVSIRKIEFYFVRAWVRLQAPPEVLDSIVVRMITSEQHSNPSLGAVIAGAYLVELRDGVFRLIHVLPDFR